MSGVRNSPMCSSANTLHSAAPLTSPQGILGVLSHGIRLIQDHQLKAFPRKTDGTT